MRSLALAVLVMLAACTPSPPYIPTHGPATEPAQAKQFCVEHPEDLLCK